jgi:hypothetical protein
MGAYECNKPTGLSSVHQHQEFRVYPNPGSGQLFLENLGSSIHDDLHLIIYDASGKKIYDEKMEKYDRITPIFIGKQANGLYVLTVLSQGTGAIHGKDRKELNTYLCPAMSTFREAEPVKALYRAIEGLGF